MESSPTICSVPSLYNWDHDQVIVPHGFLWMDMNKVSKCAYPKVLTCMYVRALQSHLLTDDLLLAYQIYIYIHTYIHTYI